MDILLFSCVGKCLGFVTFFYLWVWVLCIFIGILGFVFSRQLVMVSYTEC